MTQRYQERLSRLETVPNIHMSQLPVVAKADHQVRATRRDQRPDRQRRTNTPAHGRSPARHAARVHPTGSRIDGLNAILMAHRRPEREAWQVPVGAGRTCPARWPDTKPIVTLPGSDRRRRHGRCPAPRDGLFQVGQ
jgi:hypothetical protein